MQSQYDNPKDGSLLEGQGGWEKIENVQRQSASSPPSGVIKVEKIKQSSQDQHQLNIRKSSIEDHRQSASGRLSGVIKVVKEKQLSQDQQQFMVYLLQEEHTGSVLQAQRESPIEEEEGTILSLMSEEQGAVGGSAWALEELPVGILAR